MSAYVNQTRLCLSCPTVKSLVVKIGFIMFLSSDSIAKPKPNFPAKEIYCIHFVNV